MKKLFILGMLALCLSGCNYNSIDTDYQFNRVIIKMPNGEVMEVEIESWINNDAQKLTIVAEDGTIYLVSANNCVLLGSKE